MSPLIATTQVTRTTNNRTRDIVIRSSNFCSAPFAITHKSLHTTLPTAVGRFAGMGA